MIDKFLLFPYWFTLKIRHFIFDCGLRKTTSVEVPSICVGNVTVGGTGKTPHTEMLLSMLSADEYWGSKNIAVLSRGYKRKTRGFQQVTYDGTARQYGDEPLQIKRKFPDITVAVDRSRKEGCDFLCHPEKLLSSRKAKKCLNKNLVKADLIILDDAFQHRSVKTSVSIVLIDFNKPVFSDHLLPLGRLRDLPERTAKADIIIITKCPPGMNAWEKSQWALASGLSMYDAEKCCGIRKDGSKQYLFFTKICYGTPAPVFPEGDARYTYSQKLVLFSGIADDTPLRHSLSDSYKIVRHLHFPDHHNFSKSDIKAVYDAAESNPTSVVMTTEKDCQRIRDCKWIPDNLKQRLFYMPICTDFLSDADRINFLAILKSFLK